MLTPEQRQKITEDPYQRHMCAFEPTELELKKMFKEVPSALVILTPTRQIWREDFFNPTSVPSQAPVKPKTVSLVLNKDQVDFLMWLLERGQAEKGKLTAKWQQWVDEHHKPLAAALATAYQAFES